VLDPPAQTMTVRSDVRTVAGSRGASVSVRRVNDFTLLASGWIGDGATPRRVPVVVEDPANFAAGAFRTALSSYGVSVAGSTTVSSAPFGSLHVVNVPSPPLAQLVTMMNRESVNHYAELLFKNAGRGLDGLLSGSADAGFLKLADFLHIKVGTDPGSVYAVDGSGLSGMNRVTARAQVQLLSHAHTAAWGSIFHASLPVAGQSGTLRQRMVRSAAQGNLHAKTGTTADVVALSGYVTAENGEVMAFAFIYNGPDKDRARGTMDLLGPALAGLVRK
jgi:D-alanyl-D-alanine carboxypeptidase/D-alanyl-D-alanine-endopeptidase (penicillin-binding protein 4)